MCAAVFKERIQETGNDIKGFAERFIDADGNIDWENAGPYFFEWDENGVAKAIVHRATADKIVVTVHVDRTFGFIDPWDVGASRVVKDPCDYRMCKFFKAGSAVWAYLIDKKARRSLVVRQCIDMCGGDRIRATQGSSLYVVK